MRSIDTRLERLKAALSAPEMGRLPLIVDDTTSEAELARLRRHGREVLTFGEMVEHCVVEREPLVGGVAA